MRPSQALAEHRETIRRIVQEAGMTNPRVFGKVVRGDDGDGGDLDMLVDLTPLSTMFQLARVEKLISQSIGLPVNLLVPSELPPKFRERVLAEADPL